MLCAQLMVEVFLYAVIPLSNIWLNMHAPQASAPTLSFVPLDIFLEAANPPPTRCVSGIHCLLTFQDFQITFHDGKRGWGVRHLALMLVGSGWHLL